LRTLLQRPTARHFCTAHIPGFSIGLGRFWTYSAWDVMAATVFTFHFARAAVAVFVAAAAVCAAGGCASRFTAKTEYLAPGFSRTDLRGTTVAVMPVTDGPAGASDDAGAGALTGVARGMREAGVRVQVVPPAGGGSDPATLLAAARRGDAADAAYVLLVRTTGADPYRTYTPGHYDGPAGRPTATRTSGRRLGLRLALLRAIDGAPLWSSRGTGAAWRTRTDVVAGKTPAMTLEDDLRTGNEHFYPPPPAAETLSTRLTRRLLARLPVETALEPN
jgi:hypothetical protein